MNQYDFGYSWPWTYGHLVVAAAFVLISAIAYRLKWRRWILALAVVVTIWAVAGFLILHYRFNLSSPMEMPTASFVANVEAPSVLDVGAGSGRTTIMALASRPKSTVTSLDIFSGEFGIEDNNERRLLANIKIAGFEGRAKVQRGDMRKMPLSDATFDGAVSAYAIDHLNGEGVRQSLGEVRRVLKPGGEFLLMVINRDIGFGSLIHCCTDITMGRRLRANVGGAVSMRQAL